MTDDSTESAPAQRAAAQASELVSVLEAAWWSIQQHHPGVPDAVIVLGTGVERGRLVKLGHWWSGRWIADGTVRGEVLLAGEALHLPPGDVFEVLLHEAAHGLNAHLGIKDASRGGRYHNTRFRRTAEELGLDVALAAPYGWAATTLSEMAVTRYRAEIDAVGDAMRIARRIGPQRQTPDTETEPDGQTAPDGAGGQNARNPPAQCGCGRKLRMAPSVLAAGPVICGLCNGPFSTEPRSLDQPQTSTSPVADVTAADTVERLRSALAGPHGVQTVVAACVWYHAFQQGEDQPAVLANSVEQAVFDKVVRTLLHFDGTLEGPNGVVAGVEWSVGDRVVIDGGRSLLDVTGGQLPARWSEGTVAGVDTAAGSIAVDFDDHGTWALDTDALQAIGLRHNYATVAPETDPALIEILPPQQTPRPGRAADIGIEL